MRNKLEIKINENWTFRKVSDKKWLKAQVPGCVHTDLYHSKIIPDPFYGTNEKDIQWISHENWEYKTILNLDNEFLSRKVQLLKFYGLDTYAKVYVNGKLLIESNNMFHPWQVSVKDIFQLGENEILVLLVALKVDPCNIVESNKKALLRGGNTSFSFIAISSEIFFK